MSTNVSQPIGYTGDIQIYTKCQNCIINKVSLHNSGTSQLFNLLANCLAGNFVSIQHLTPSRINLFNQNDALIIQTEQTTTPTITLDTVNITGATTFHFKIPYASISQHTAIKKLELVSKDGLNILATLTLDQSDYIQLTDITDDLNTVLLINWSLNIANAT